jgi:hypothetical protein
MSVLAARMSCMTEGRALRRIGDPVVAAAPAGVRTRTRIHPTAADAEALTAIGELLGAAYRCELAGRVGLGQLDREAHALWRAERKQALTAVSSSRWAGAITRAVEDQYQLGMRGLAAHVADLRAAVDVLGQRCGLRPGELEPVDSGEENGRSRSRRRRRGYRSAAERFVKTRRLAALRGRLVAAEEALAVGRPSITVGGKRLWRNRNHLDAADMTAQQWRNNWDAARMFLTADGESGKAGGNETIRVDEAGRLRIKVPAKLVDQFSTHLVIAAPVGFTHRGQEWWARVTARRAVRYDISYDPARGRWYLDASWKANPEPAPELDDVRTGPVLGVDLNADHVAACVLDSSGNPIGEPVTIAVETAGLGASRRDGRVRGHQHAAGPGPSAELLGDRGGEPRLRRRARHRARNPGSRQARETVAPHRRRHTHRKVPHPADRHGRAAWGRDHRGGPGLHQPLGRPALAHTLTTTDFRSGHRHHPSRGGGRDRQTWPGLGDQATAGRTPHPTADACGHFTG